MTVGFFSKIYTRLKRLLAMNWQRAWMIAKESELNMPCKNLFLRLLDDDSGATAIEYGLIIALISITMILSFQGLGLGLNGVWTNVDNAVTGATSS
jgi:pilus assembly protein Flp/PilA